MGKDLTENPETNVPRFAAKKHPSLRAKSGFVRTPGGCGFPHFPGGRGQTAGFHMFLEKRPCVDILWTLCESCVVLVQSLCGLRRGWVSSAPPQSRHKNRTRTTQVQIRSTQGFTWGPAFCFEALGKCY